MTMSVFARNDLAYVHLSGAHGGCGDPHRRPFEHGAPARQWKLTCAQCENHLATDPNWSTTAADIPETPDEVKGREDFQKRGAADRDNVLAIAMAKLAGVELPATIRQSISGISPDLPAVAGFLVCQGGHDCEPGSKFCAECGAPMREASVMACPQGHLVGQDARFCPECGAPMMPPEMAGAPAVPAAGTAVPQAEAPKRRIRDMRADELRVIARARGLDDSGSRTQVLDRIRAAVAGTPDQPAAA